MKKILSVILGLALCCMLAALPVCAEETAGPVQAEAAEIGDGYVTLVSDSECSSFPSYVDEEAEGAVGTVEQAMADFSVGGTIMGLINDSGIYDIYQGQLEERGHDSDLASCCSIWRLSSSLSRCC